MGVIDEVCITFFEGDVVVFPLELLCKPLVQVADIGKWFIPCFLDVAILGPTHLPSEMRSAEDLLNLAYGSISGLSFYRLALLSLT